MKKKIDVQNIQVVLSVQLAETATYLQIGRLYHYSFCISDEVQNPDYRELEIMGTMAVRVREKRRCTLKYNLRVQRSDDSGWYLKQFVSVSYKTPRGWKDVGLDNPNLKVIEDLRQRIKG